MIIKTKCFTLFIVILLVSYSCDKANDPVVKDIVINELLAVNFTVVADQNGEFDDWFELYNMTKSPIDLSGYFLSDNKSKISKWKIPEGTTIQAEGFLVIWADKDTTQSGLHANFKLSSTGEELVLSKPDLTLIDEIDYPPQALELSYSRVPDGTGPFNWGNPTFNSTNNSAK